MSTALHRFDLDLRELQKDLLELGRAAPAVMARSVNRAATSGRAAMTKAVTADTGIAKKGIDRQIKVDKATRTRPTVAVIISGKPMPLIDFRARGPEPSRGRGKGVSYRSPGGGTTKRLRTAFIARVRGVTGTTGDHRGVFVRKPKPSPRRGGKPMRAALPIVERKTPPLPHWFENKLPVFRDAAQVSLVKNLKHEISFARSKNAGD